MPEYSRRDLERIRQQQIAARNPGESKIKGYNWDKHDAKMRRINKARKDQSLIGELYGLMPQRWRGALLGLLLGIFVGLVMILVFLQAEWQVLALIPPLFGGLVGFIIGKLFEPPPIK